MVIFVKVELPNDNWAVLRGVDELNTGDKIAVKRAMRIPVARDGQPTEMTGAFQDEQRIALLGRVITEWSYVGWPIPSQAMSPEAAIEQLPIGAYDKLCDAVKDHMEAIDYNPS